MQLRLDDEQCADLVAGYDLVADGSDNFATRYLLNDACFACGKPLVGAALSPFDGQLSTFKSISGRRIPVSLPLPRGAAARAVPRCEDGRHSRRGRRRYGHAPGDRGLKELLGIGESLSGTLLMYDALSAGFHKIKIRAIPIARPAAYSEGGWARPKKCCGDVVRPFDYARRARSALQGEVDY